MRFLTLILMIVFHTFGFGAVLEGDCFLDFRNQMLEKNNILVSLIDEITVSLKDQKSGEVTVVSVVGGSVRQNFWSGQAPNCITQRKTLLEYVYDLEDATGKKIATSGCIEKFFRDKPDRLPAHVQLKNSESYVPPQTKPQEIK